MENLYLIKCNEFYKIGIANDLESRLAALQTGNPYPLVAVACFQFPNAGVVEKALHQAFADVRELGEWFELGNAGVDRFLTTCVLLGGARVDVAKALVDDSEIEDAEELQKVALGVPSAWDFSAMFADGWRMLTTDNRKKYWCWRKRKNGENKVIYGGVIAKLPQPIEEIRRIHGAETEVGCDL